MSFVNTLLIFVFWTWAPMEARTVRGPPYQTENERLTCRITVLSTLEQRGNESMAIIEETVCIPIVHGAETSTLFSIHLPDAIQHKYNQDIQAGTFFVSIEGAYKVKEEVVVSGESSIWVLKENPLPNRRLTNVDERKVLVIRISMSSGAQVGYSAAKINEYLFNRENSFAMKMKGCLNGNIEMKSVGVFEVTVPGATSDFSSAAEIRNKAAEILAQQEGVASLKDLADHVMVILPENEFPNFVANAGTNHHMSTYNNLWSLDMMVYMHEIGHNLGLNHAYLSNGKSDFSSNMSPTGWAPNLNGPLKCYNAADNANLGYYNSRTVVVDLDAAPIQSVSLAAFSEWDKSVNQDPVLVSFGKYKMQYNLASAQNQGTEILRNAITIAYAESGKTVVHLDGLVPSGGVFTVENFDSTQKTLQVEACAQNAGDQMTPGTMAVAITLGIKGSPCLAAVADKTAPPTKSPSAAPIASPSESPSAMPTASPTSQGPVVELWVIDVTDGSDAMKLQNGGSFQIDTRGSQFPEGFSIEAKQVGSSIVESVRFFKNGSSSYFKTENYVPYAIAGDRRNKYHPWTNYPMGTFQLSAIAYSGNRGTGIAGNPVEVKLEVLV